MVSRFKDPMECGIYGIISPSGNQYIGSSINISHRFKDHKRQLERNTHHSLALQNAWNKYTGNLEFKKILICRPEDLLFYEQLLIDNWKPKYNMNPIAESSLGIKRRPESIEKTRQKNIGRKLSEETKLKMSLAHKGRPQHPNVRAAQLGRKNSPATIEKMRLAGLRRYGKVL